jgi:hypothetical protein
MSDFTSLGYDFSRYLFSHVFKGCPLSKSCKKWHNFEQSAFCKFPQIRKMQFRN